MKTNKLKQALLCSAVAVAMPTMTIAATNPAGTTATSTTTSSGTISPPNGFKPDGLGTITNTNKNQASTPSESTSGGKIESPQKVENADLEEAVENCPIAEEQPQAVNDAVQAAMVVPDIDGMFNKVTKEAEGCFANSGQVINLAMEIDIPTFNGGIGTAINKAIEKVVMAKAEEMKNQFCEIADAALLDTLGPVQKYLQEYQSRAAELEGITGNIGEARDPAYGKVLGTIGTKIDEAEVALNKRGEVAAQTANQAKQKLEGIKSEVNSNLEGAIKGSLDSDIGNKVADVTGSYKEVPATNPSTSRTIAPRTYATPPINNSSNTSTTSNISNNSTTSSSSSRNPYLSESERNNK